MNNLLPRYDELIPILDKNNTFFDCGFNVSFEELEFKKKLQVINDIVRQTILPIYPLQPNPQDEVETLIGNCHTAALVSKKYLEELKIGKNIRYVMARKRPFDPDNITTKHAILLIDDDLGNTYQYDATPFVGYKFGCVERIDIERFYDEYVEIKGKLKHLLYVLRKILYDISIEKIELKHMRYYIKKLEESEKYSILNGIVASIYVKLSKLCVLS